MERAPIQKLTQDEPKATVHPHYNKKTASFLVLMLVNWYDRWVSCIAAHRVLKKHLHLHRYKIIPVHELRERPNIKRVEYFRDVITVDGEDILDITSFTDEV
jgi:hypothetical protein